MMFNKRKIYFDLDDVAADFFGYVNNKLKKTYHIGESLSQSDWSILRHDHQRIFADLDVVIPIQLLIRQLSNSGHDIAFLTAIPFDGQHPWPYAPIDKIKWVSKHFDKTTPCFFGPYAHDKSNHCKAGDILIDDKFSNCADWISAGGIAHLYRNHTGLIDFLENEGVCVHTH